MIPITWYNTVDREIFAGKIFRLLKFRVVYFSSYAPTYTIHNGLTNVHKNISPCLIFVGKDHRRKFFNDGKFPIYGISPLLTSSGGGLTSEVCFLSWGEALGEPLATVGWEEVMVAVDFIASMVILAVRLRGWNRRLSTWRKGGWGKKYLIH
jgi:hypothetical protein